MSLTFQTRTVAVSWPAGEPSGADFATAELLAIAHPYGETWGAASLRFPRARAQDAATLSGKAVRITYDGRTVFAGHITEMPMAVSAGADGIVVEALDYRWYLSKRFVGQFGIGSADETSGGFPIIGYRVHFNPDGRYNRSAAKSGDAYTFSDAADADAWRAQDILEFLLAYYGAGVDFDVAELPAGWDDIEPDFFCYAMPVTEALSRLAARRGCAWSIRYDGASVLFRAIALTSTDTAAVVLAEHGDGATTRSATEWHARTVRVLPRITDSVDRVEVHSAPVRVDMTLTTLATDTDAVLGLLYFDASPMGYEAGYVMDRSLFPAGLLTDLQMIDDQRPLRWHRELSTRTTAARDDYAAAGADEVLAGAGEAVWTEHNVWLAFKGGSTPRRVKAGIRIVPEAGLLLLGPAVELHDGTILTENTGDLYDVWISTCVEWSQTATTYSVFPPAAGYLVDAAHAQTQVVVRSDIVPRLRYKLILPDMTSSDPDAQVTYAPTVQTYRAIQDDMDAVYQTLAAIRKKEVTVIVELLDIPDIIPGAMLTIAPANLGLPADLVVTHFQADFAQSSSVTLYATNNLARVISGDL